MLSQTATDAAKSATAATATRPRVGVLTLHYGYNHGALLQSYATAKLFGGEIIDHRYRRKVDVYTHDRKLKPFLTEFLEEGLPLSSYRCLAEDFQNDSTWRYAESAYDLLVCGSDELWKLRYSPPRRRWLEYLHGVVSPRRTWWNLAQRQTSRWNTPFPNVYWPDVRIPKVAFAASAGETTLENIPAAHRERMSDCLSRFAMLGVRDRSTASLIGGLAPALAERLRAIPDPVFTLESDPAWTESALEKLRRCGVETSRKMAFMHITRSDDSTMRKELAHLGYEAVNVLTMPLSPLEWFAAIGKCACGVTDAMHPLISSLAQNVPCWSWDSRRKSVELRQEFGVDGYGSIGECIRGWPDDVATKADDCKQRVRRFVDDAMRVAACQSP